MMRLTRFSTAALMLILSAAISHAADGQLTIAIDMGRGDGVFLQPDGLPIQALVKNTADLPIPCVVRWTIQTDQDQQLATVSNNLKLAGGSAQEVVCEFSPPTPGFYLVKCSLDFALSDNPISASKILAYRPEEIETELTKQNDFDEFWQQTLEDLAAVAPEFALKENRDLATDTHDVFEVSMKSLGNVRVRGWYERPKLAGKHPALLRVPGYGGNMRPTGRTETIAILSFNPRGHGNSQDDVPGKPQDYWIRGLDDKQGYFYQGAYADCVRAVDFLASRSEVDADFIGVTGGSQGGGLSLATAGLDPRIAVCAPDIAFLCNWERYFKTSKWPEMDNWIADGQDRTWESTLRTMSYFDTLNFTDRISCPTLFSVGLQDGVCPPVTIFAVYNQLAGPKQYRVYPHTRHAVPRQHHEERWTWLTRELGATAE